MRDNVVILGAVLKKLSVCLLVLKVGGEELGFTRGQGGITCLLTRVKVGVLFDQGDMQREKLRG